MAQRHITQETGKTTTTPRGLSLLRDPRLNKSTAFTEAEREALGLLSVNNSVITGNASKFGGGIYSDGDVSLTNTTIGTPPIRQAPREMCPAGPTGTGRTLSPQTP